MFRRELVRERDRVSERFRLDEIAVVIQRAADEVAARERGQLLFNFALHR
jgi:hypothetical protein